MSRLTFLILLVLPVGVGARPKDEPIVQPDDVRAALAELGIVRAPKLLLEIPDEYAADAVSVDEVRKNPKKYPLRAGVLRAVEVLKPVRAAVPISEYRAGAPKAKEAIKAKQMPLAAMIDDLADALDDLRRLDTERGKESSMRWRAHYDFVLAEAMVRSVALNEINKAYAHVLVDLLPEPKGRAALASWKLVPAVKLLSGREVREQMGDARGKLTVIVRTFKSLDATAPWYYLVEDLVEKPAGLRWELVEPKE